MVSAYYRRTSARNILLCVVSSALFFSFLPSCATGESVSYLLASPEDYHKLPQETLSLTYKDPATLRFWGDRIGTSANVRTLVFDVNKGARLGFLVEPVNSDWKPKLLLRRSDVTAQTTSVTDGAAHYLPSDPSKSIQENLNNGYLFDESGSYSLDILASEANNGQHFIITIYYKPPARPLKVLPGKPLQPDEPEQPEEPDQPEQPDTPGDPQKPSDSNGLEGSSFAGLEDGQVGEEFRRLNSGGKSTAENRYRPARVFMFAQLDNQNGEVECVYTGRKVRTDSIPSSSGPLGMNTEHTWPQSLGGGGETKADLHHLFPTDAKTNSARSHFPFCEVSVTNKEFNGSKLGRDAHGTKCFEPRDSHKGNVARAMFYVSTMKKLPIDPQQEAFLRKWHLEDPVDDAEKVRESGIYGFQGTHNYFVIYPDLVSKISDF